MKCKLVAVIAAVTLSVGSGASAAVAAVGPPPPPVTSAAALAVAAAPGAPTGLTGANATATSITLSWTPPVNSDPPIARYVVRLSRNNGLTWPAYGYPPVTSPAGTTWTWTGLTPDTDYRFQVIALNSVGWGAWSATSTAESTTSTTAPSEPLSVTGTKGNGKVSLTWQAPSNTGGEPITGYGVEYQPVGGTTWTTALLPSAGVTAKAYTVTGLTDGTAYIFRVVAANAIGAGLWSAPSPAYTPAATAPKAPTALTAGTATLTSIALSWTPPADNGGATITRYVVRRSTNGGLTWAYGYPPVGNPAGTSWTWTGLTPATPYVFQVIAMNSAGWGAWSATTPAVSTVTPDTTAPGPVTGLWVDPDSSTATSVALRWVNPADADFTGVMIRRALGATPPATVTDGTLVRDLTDLPGQHVPYVVDVGTKVWVPAPGCAPSTLGCWRTVAGTEVTAGTQYSYAFFAHDAANNYAAAANVTYTTATGAHAPGPVTALTATAVSATSIKLDWVNPGDLDFTGVTIRRAVGATAPASATTGDPVTDTASATATSFTDIGLIAGTVYSYALFAHDGAGNNAAAVNVTVAAAPTAVLLVTSDGEFFDFDASGSTAVTPKTLSTGTLDYGDGTALEMLSGVFGWSGSHTYVLGGTYVVTLTVTDSAGVSATTVETVTVATPPGAPTATIVGNPTGAVGVSVVFTLTSTSGTPITSWTVADDAGIYEAANGTPPGTVSHTFTAAGEYTVRFNFNNEAGQTAQSSMVVVVS